MNSDKKRERSYSPNMRRPGEGAQSGRGIFGIILCLLIPPLGLMFLWRKGVFRTRGRMLLTGLATLEMAILAVLLMPRPELATITPVPAVPARATPAPESEVKTALSNIDQLLYEKQLEEVLAQGGTEKDLLSQEEQMALIEQEQAEILSSIVYSVTSGARFYHKEPVCGNQSNRRELTVEEAMLEGMGACPDCSPPVYGFAAD